MDWKYEVMVTYVKDGDVNHCKCEGTLKEIFELSQNKDVYQIVELPSGDILHHRVDGHLDHYTPDTLPIGKIFK